jgi:hypothetical protein
MKKLTWLGLLLIILMALHQLLVIQAKNKVLDVLQKESPAPAQVQVFRGFLPIGQIWFRQLDFTSKLGNHLIQWNLPNGMVDLGFWAYLKGAYLIEELNLTDANWKTTLGGWDFKGIFNVKGLSKETIPVKETAKTIWCEKVNLTSPVIQGIFQDQTYPLVYQGQAVFTPVCIQPEGLVMPVHFEIAGKFTPTENATRLTATGNLFPSENRMNVDLALVAVEVPVLERYLGIASQNPGFPKIQVADWIRDGSLSVRLEANAQPEQIAGNLTLRLKRVRFGPQITESELVGDTLSPILQSLETQDDTLQLGPVAFQENLDTPEEEAFTQIQRGLASELLRKKPAAALQSGINLLKKMWDR